MDQKKDDDKKPAIPIPTLRDSKNAPQLKIKGLAQGGLSLMERLKQFKKKDMAFILAGLGVLFLAPLAEHFMMAPEGDQGGMQGSFGARGGEGMFGKGSSPYEPGVNGLAPGGMAGGGSDVITPLNVRDPAALVMGPGATQQPPATSAPAPAAPSKPESNDWKDALAQSAAKAGGAAAKAAALPVPKVPLSAGGLRGLGAVSGGGGGSFSLPAISASNVPNKAAMSSSPGPTGGAGIKGIARGEGQGGNPGNLESLKKAAANAAGLMNGPGSASSNLEQAAKTSFGDGSGGGAGEGGGASDKASGQSGDKNSKNADGQSLAFLKAKQEQEKAIEFEWKKKEAADRDLLWYKIRDKMAEELAMTPLKAITGDIAKAIGKFGKNPSNNLYCWKAGGDPKSGVTVIDSDNVVPMGQTTKSDEVSTGEQYFAYKNGDDLNYGTLYNSQGNPMYECSGGKAGQQKPPTPDNTATTGIGGIMSAGDYKKLCDTMTTFTQVQQGKAADPKIAAAAKALGDAAKPLATADGALNTGQVVNLPCGAAAVDGAVPGQPMSYQLGIAAADGSPDTNNKTGTWYQLNDIFGKMGKLQGRDKQVVDAINGANGGSLAEQLEKIRAAVSKDPQGDALPADAVQAIGAMKDKATGLLAAAGDSANVDSDFQGIKFTDVSNNLVAIQKQLAGTQAALNQADSQIGNADSPLRDLKSSNASMGQTMDKYLEGLKKTRDDLKAKLTQATAEYNRQAALPDGVLKQLQDMKPGLAQIDQKIQSDIKGDQPDGAKTVTPEGAAFDLTKLAGNVGKITPKAPPAGGGAGPVKDTNFKEMTNEPSDNAIDKAKLEPYATDVTNITNATGPNQGNLPVNKVSIDSISKKITNKSQDPGTTIAPAPAVATP